MRVSLQHVKKCVSVRYVRDGVFGSSLQEPSSDDKVFEEWDDVVCVMSMDEASSLLELLNFAEACPWALPWKYASSPAASLKSVLAKLSRGNGDLVFTKTVPRTIVTDE